MAAFSGLDILALGFFVAAWLFYHWGIERSIGSGTQRALNARMNLHRSAWMEHTVHRENRIVDTTIMASLQNGTAFFASTSLLAVGGALTLLQTPDEVLTLFAGLPFGSGHTRTTWELKVIGLAIVLVYAFFKFSWSYRLFNYAAILLGAIPLAGRSDEAAMQAAAARAARMNQVAGAHFNRGQRAFFFGLAYLGWFVGAGLFMAATAFVILVMWRRQFASDALAALE